MKLKKVNNVYKVIFRVYLFDIKLFINLYVVEIMLIFLEKKEEKTFGVL